MKRSISLLALLLLLVPMGCKKKEREVDSLNNLIVRDAAGRYLIIQDAGQRGLYHVNPVKGMTPSFDPGFIVQQQYTTNPARR